MARGRQLLSVSPVFAVKYILRELDVESQESRVMALGLFSRILALDSYAGITSRVIDTSMSECGWIMIS